jgi:hypothetical protein
MNGIIVIPTIHLFSIIKYYCSSIPYLPILKPHLPFYCKVDLCLLLECMDMVYYSQQKCRAKTKLIPYWPIY